MDIKLFLQAIIKVLSGLIIVCLLLFVPAGSIYYMNGWLFIAILFIPMFIAGFVMLFKSPNLLRSRLNANERLKEQKIVVISSGIMFILGFVLAGLNYRFKIIFMDDIVVYIAIVIFLISYLMYGIVLKQNSFLYKQV